MSSDWKELGWAVLFIVSRAALFIGWVILWGFIFGGLVAGFGYGPTAVELAYIAGVWFGIFLVGPLIT